MKVNLSDGTRKWLRIGGQVVLGVIIVWFVYQSLYKGFTSANLTKLHFDLRWLLVSWLFLAGYYALYTLGLNVIMRDLGSPSTYPKAFKLNFASNLGKYVPGGFWPALGRAALAPAMSLSRAHAAVSMVLEAGFSTAAGIAVFAVSLAFGGVIPAHTYWWEYVALAAVIVVCLHPAVFGRALGWAFKVAKVRQEPPRLSYTKSLVLFVVYGASWIVAGFGMQFFAMACQTNVPFEPLVFAGAYGAASVVGLIVLFAPGGIGAREVTLALLITPVVGPGNSAIIAFAARVWSTLLELVLSAIALAMPSPGGGAAALEDGADEGPHASGGPAARGPRA